MEVFAGRSALQALRGFSLGNPTKDNGESAYVYLITSNFCSFYDKTRRCLSRQIRRIMIESGRGSIKKFVLKQLVRSFPYKNLFFSKLQK